MVPHPIMVNYARSPSLAPRARFKGPIPARSRSRHLPRVACAIVLASSVALLVYVLRPSPPLHSPGHAVDARTGTTNFDFDTVLPEHDFEKYDEDLGEVGGTVEDREEEEVVHTEPVRSPATGGRHSESFLPCFCTPLYRPPDSLSIASNGTTFDTARILERSLLYGGSGREVRRVLGRAAKSSVYGKKRRRKGAVKGGPSWEGEESFRVLVLGGSVSNCRGVDPKSECWHSHLTRWLQHTLPLEGDGRVSRHHHRPRSVEFVIPPSMDVHPAVSASKVLRRKRPLHQLINGAKSATGSSFFAHCLNTSMSIRRQRINWDRGIDLVVVEFGVNDVWPSTTLATRHFEQLIRQLRSLPSKPAIVILEAASLLLARTTFGDAKVAMAEYLHLPVAHFYDVPLLSAKDALFSRPITRTYPILQQSNETGIEDLFLPDRHHPNALGHHLLATVLTTYLESQLCVLQSQVQQRRLAMGRDGEIDGDDFGRRDEEVVESLPHRSVLDPYFPESVDLEEHEERRPQCEIVGNPLSNVLPLRNKGWSYIKQSRDKQYLAADVPGSTVTFGVTVGEDGGDILLDFLRSRYFELGSVRVYLNSSSSPPQTLTGHWELGWSISVPTVVFTGVEQGYYELTLEVLSALRNGIGMGAVQGERGTAFRLTGIIVS